MGNQNSSLVIPTDTIRVAIRVDRSCSNLSGIYTIAPEFREELEGLISIENYIAEINRMNAALETTVFERITPYSNIVVFVLVTLVILLGRLSAAALLLLFIFIIVVSAVLIRIGSRARFQRLKVVINEINRLHTILEFSYGSFQMSEFLSGDSGSGLTDHQNRHHFIDVRIRRGRAYELSENLNFNEFHSVIPVVNAVNVSPYTTGQQQNNGDNSLPLADVLVIGSFGEQIQGSFQLQTTVQADPVLL